MQQVADAVLAFVNAPTWEESKEIVEARREELLTEAADQVFAALLEEYKSDTDAVRHLAEHRPRL